MSRFISLSELNNPEPKAKVRAKSDGLYLTERCDQDPPEKWRYTYPIAWNRIDTPTKLLYWIRHLVGKSWVDSQMIEEIIDTVDRKYNIRVMDP